MRTLDVLICDDHEIFRDGLKSVMEDMEEIRVVGEADNGFSCIEAVKELDPDILLLDIRMPDMNGIECLKRLRAFNKQIKVLAITQFEEKRLVKQMMKHGANGYLLKHVTPNELQTAFRKVYKGKTYLSKELEEGPILHTISNDVDPILELTDREKQITRLICAEYNTREIAEHLGLSVKTVENQRTALFRKVQVLNVAGLVKWAVLNGYDA